MFETRLRGVRDSLSKISRGLLRRGQIALSTSFGLILGGLMASPARDLTVSLVAITIYFVTIVAEPLSGLLLWAIAYPFAEATIRISLGASIPDLSPTRFCFSFLAALLLAQAATGERSFPRLRGADVAALLFVVGMGLSIPAAIEPLRAAQVIFDAYLLPMLAYFLARNLVLEKRDLNRLLNGFLIIGAYTGAYAIYEQLTGNILFVEVEPWMMRGLGRVDEGAGSIRVLRGLYGGHNVFGLILGLTLPIAFHRLINASTLRGKMLYAILVALMLGGDFSTFKRASWLSLIVSFFVIQFFYPQFRRIFLVLLVVFGMVWFLAGDRIAESDVGVRATYKLDTLNTRTDRWSSAIELWKQKPFVGHGFKQFDSLSGFNAVESYYLHILVSAGLIAFVPFMAFILLVVKESIAIFRQAPSNPRLFVNRKVIATFWGMLAVYLLVSASNYMAMPIKHLLPYILMGGIVSSQGVLLERRRRARPALVDRATS